VIEPQSVVSVLAVTLLGTAGLLSMLPIGTCNQCSHCRLEKLERERKHELQRESASIGGTFCVTCGGRHRPNEDHRI
jgi:hypothetical protein